MHDLAFRDLNTLLKFSHPYIDRFKRHIGSFQDDLWAHLETVPNLDPAVSSEVLSYLLDLACRSQNILNIDLGRAGLMALPKPWLLEHIQSAAESQLDLRDDWEYRRLLEVAWKLDRGLVETLTSQGLRSSNPGVREAAEDSNNELNES